jgi:hypothetical protein
MVCDTHTILTNEVSHMSIRTDVLSRRPETFQVFRRTDGAFACKPDRLPLCQDEMLIGRGLAPDEAAELVEEFNGGFGSGRGGLWA